MSENFLKILIRTLIQEIAERQAMKMVWPHRKLSGKLNAMMKKNNRGLTREKR